VARSTPTAGDFAKGSSPCSRRKVSPIDIGALSRCAVRPAHLGGATVETARRQILMPWLDWAFAETQKAAYASQGAA
jgi:hypothetical protein